jgi:hypothetical protein
MLKHNEANPLAVFGLRELEHCPPHFTRYCFDLKTTEKNISDWIWTNLSGRFWFGDHYFKDPANNVALQKCAAFEIAGEASMFALMLDQINNRDFLDF